MRVWQTVLFTCVLMSAVVVPAYSVSGVEVSGDLNLSGTGTVSFPDGSKQTTAACRYEDNGDGTVTDCRSGLIWLKDANCLANLGGIDRTSPGRLNWTDAGAWVGGLGNGFCGLNDLSVPGDWRLPTWLEWTAMVAYARSRYNLPALTDAAGTAQWTTGHPFLNVVSDFYWSASSNAGNAGYAWVVSMASGDVYPNGIKTTDLFYVWPVHGGQ